MESGRGFRPRIGPPPVAGSSPIPAYQGGPNSLHDLRPGTLGPDEERVLSERARGRGRDLTEYVHQVLQDHIRAAGQDERATGTPPSPDDLIDHDVIGYCERDADDSITLEEVRAATAKIQDAMARVVIEEERAERF